MPKAIALHRRLKDQGLVLLGIHTTGSGEKMADYAKKVGIDFPIAIDIENKTTKAFGVDSYPDYYLIDRAGKLRVADIQNGDFERAVSVLLAEKAPEPTPPASAVVHVDAAGAKALIEKNKKLVLLDIRTPGEWKQGCVKNATRIDFRSATFAAEVAKLDRETATLVYCASGGRSTRSLKVLKELGFEHVIHLDGGFRGWQAAGYSVVK